ncbi:MAG: phosphatase PAP2 family protein [Lachnospiraceae bacterium]|nr:phosphatase PAP2 family protein [Lachnospiraceae bacterium]
MKLKKEWFRYWWTLFYFPVYMTVFILEEKLITSDYHIIGIALDEKIPFIEWFFFPYYIWFPYILLVGLWLFFRDKKAFLKTICFLYTGMTIFLIVSAVYPNGLNLRPDLSTINRDNIAIRLAKRMYETDTPTNVLPSIHVFNSLGMMCGIGASERRITPYWMKWLVCVLGVSISCSTVFVKQHSLVDVFVAFGLAIVSYLLFFRGKAAAKIDSIDV